MAKVTRDWMRNYINTQPTEKVIQLVGRSLVVLLDLQTAEEQRATNTLLDNGVGFTGADGRVGTLSARAFKSKGTLLDWQLAQWTKVGKSGYPRIAKYHAQLNAAAKAKAAKGCTAQQYRDRKELPYQPAISRAQAIAHGVVTYTGD